MKASNRRLYTAAQTILEGKQEEILNETTIHIASGKQFTLPQLITKGKLFNIIVKAPEKPLRGPSVVLTGSDADLLKFMTAPDGTMDGTAKWNGQGGLNYDKKGAERLLKTKVVKEGVELGSKEVNVLEEGVKTELSVFVPMTWHDEDDIRDKVKKFKKLSLPSQQWAYGEVRINGPEKDLKTFLALDDQGSPGGMGFPSNYVDDYIKAAKKEAKFNAGAAKKQADRVKNPGNVKRLGKREGVEFGSKEVNTLNENRNDLVRISDGFNGLQVLFDSNMSIDSLVRLGYPEKDLKNLVKEFDKLHKKWAKLYTIQREADPINF